MSSQEFLSRALKTIAKKAEVQEIDIENPFVKYAKRCGCKALKLIFLNKKGFPDRTILCPGGRIFFIEFKRDGKKQSPSQKLVQILLESFSFEYYVCDQKGQAEKILTEFLDNDF